MNKVFELLQPLLRVLAKYWPWLDKKLNHLAINLSVNYSRHRPHPWSTRHSYVSWLSLTDKEWSARHLPETDITHANPKTIMELFRRKNFRKSERSTLLFPAFAQYLTDGFIRTKMPQNGEDDDPIRKQNTSNHDIDLCPLYGRTEEQTLALRLLSEEKGKKGRLKTQLINNEEYPHFLFENGQVKSEFEALDPPLVSDKLLKIPQIKDQLFAVGGDRVNATPMVSMMNTLFLREHNRLAYLIEEANPEWDDERVFHVARNTVVVMYIILVVEEYINHISPDFSFKADPSVAWDAAWNKPNWITSEFSLLYRWHPLIPDEVQWGGKNYPIVKTLFNNQLMFQQGLAKSFIDMSTQVAGEIGSFNTSEALIHLEEKAIEQGQLVKLASYSDYCDYVGLDRPNAFSDITKNEEAIKLLKEHYPSVDEVEFYVGMFAEDRDSSSPLPPLLRRMVAVDAFSQALTNPLLSKHVFNESTFSSVGWKAIQTTKTLRQIVDRNSTGSLSESDYIGMNIS